MQEVLKIHPAKPQQPPHGLKPGVRDQIGAQILHDFFAGTAYGFGSGVQHRGRAVLGFKTPSRRREVKSEFVRRTGLNEDTSDLTKLANSKGKNRPDYHKGSDVDIYPWPKYEPIDEHQDMRDDQLER